MSDQSPQEGELILYHTADDAVCVGVLYESEIFRLDQRRMAELFGVDVRTVSYHLKEVYTSGDYLGELLEYSVQGLYVALTRASKSLTIVSNSRTFIAEGT